MIVHGQDRSCDRSQNPRRGGRFASKHTTHQYRCMTIAGLAAYGWPDGMKPPRRSNTHGSGPIVLFLHLMMNLTGNRAASLIQRRGGGKDAKLTASSSNFYRSCELRLGFSGYFPELLACGGHFAGQSRSEKRQTSDRPSTLCRSLLAIRLC